MTNAPRDIKPPPPPPDPLKTSIADLIRAAQQRRPKESK